MLLTEDLPAAAVGGVVAQLAHHHRARTVSCDQFQVAHLARRFEPGQLLAQGEQQGGKLGFQHRAALQVDQPAGVAGAKAEMHAALGVHLDPQPGAPPIAKRRARQQLRWLRQDYALPCQQLDKRRALVFTLRCHRQMLQVAAATLAVVGTRGSTRVAAGSHSART